MAAASGLAIACSAFNLDVASNGLTIGATGVSGTLTVTTSASTAVWTAAN